MSRSDAVTLPWFITAYAGDTLWSVAAYLTILMARPSVSIATAAVTTVAISFAVEFSQLLQIGWLNALRNTTLGALFLGHGFVLSDLLCYLSGSLIVAALDRVLLFGSPEPLR